MTQPAETNGDEITSWIPLTTSFSVPQSCSALFFQEGPSLVAFDPGYGVSIEADAVCQPPAVTTWWLQGSIFEQNGLRNSHTAWSLLPLTCPQGFYTAASSILRGGATTLAFCCPNDYSVVNGAGGTNFGNCASDVSQGQIATYVVSQGSGFKTRVTTFQVGEYIGAIAVQGYAFSAAAPSSTTSMTSATPKSTPNIPILTSSGSIAIAQPSTSSSILSAMTVSTSPTSNGLTTGAEAGIGIGAAVGFIGITALIVAIILMMRRHKVSPAPVIAHTSDIIPHGPPKGENQRYLEEKSCTPTGNIGWSEMPAEAPVHELDGGQRTTESDRHVVGRRGRLVEEFESTRW